MKTTHPLVDQLLVEIDCLLRVHRNPELLHDQLTKVEDLCAQLLTAGKLPKEPPPALIESMCLRYDHSFGLDKVEGSLSSGWTEDQRQVLRATMRQLYEEVAGHGFYRWQ